MTPSSADLELLRRFYADLYTGEFPDPNERESVENMEQYLRLKADGWYQRNNYHILLYMDRDTPVAGAIIDYLAEPNVGIIEFLLVSPAHRRSGLGRKTLQWIERTLNDDSRCAGYHGYAYLVAEMNDPYKQSDQPDSMDPFERALVWHRWGFRKLRFPYVQPALSPDKQAVRNLLLMCKPAPTSDASTISAATVRDAVYNYAHWAMRIDDPSKNQECLEMAAFLAGRSTVGLLPLDTYAGAGGRLVVAEQRNADDPTMDAVLDVYAHEFNDGPTSISKELFKRFLRDDRQQSLDPNTSRDYHLVSIAVRAEDRIVLGMASFFTLRGTGFIGYIVLEPAVRGRGYLPEVTFAIERMMVRDDRGASGWYGECDPASNAVEIFAKLGCHEVDIVYRQPPLPAQQRYAFEDAPVLRLIYKAFGETFAAPRITKQDFLDAVSEIYRTVYQIEQPELSDYYRAIQVQLEGRECVTWR